MAVSFSRIVPWVLRISVVELKQWQWSAMAPHPHFKCGGGGGARVC
jgi:hypothetical protein